MSDRQHCGLIAKCLTNFLNGHLLTVWSLLMSSFTQRWQGSFCADLQDMDLDLSASNLADKMA